MLSPILVSTQHGQDGHVMEMDNLDSDGKRPQHLPTLTEVPQNRAWLHPESTQPSSQLVARHMVLLAAGLVYFWHQEMSQFPLFHMHQPRSQGYCLAKSRQEQRGRESLFMKGLTENVGEVQASFTRVNRDAGHVAELLLASSCSDSLLSYAPERRLR